MRLLVGVRWVTAGALILAFIGCNRDEGERPVVLEGGAAARAAGTALTPTALEARRVESRYVARHAVSGLDTTFDIDSVTLAGRRGLAVGLAQVGCPGQLQAVSAAAPRAVAGRIDYERGELTEWYVNRPDGLEQGFTLTRLPDCSAADGRVVVRLAENVGGRVLVPADGRQAAIRSAKGEQALFRELHAHDAEGRALDIRFASAGAALEMIVDVTNARLPIEIDPLISQGQARLKPTSPTASASFGADVAISGDTVAITAPGEKAAYVFVRGQTGWTQQQRLTSSTASTLASIAVDGERILAGAETESAAYVFLRQGTTWGEEKRLTRATTHFGSGVALRGDDALVGSSYPFGCDSTRLFVRSGSDWVDTKTLTFELTEGLCGSTSLAFDGDTMLVGVELDDGGGQKSGAVHLYYRDEAWAEHRLKASDAKAFDFFGHRVALGGGAGLVATRDAATAYYYVKSAGAYAELTKVSLGVPSELDYISSVAVSGKIAVIGTPLDDTQATDAGAVHVYLRSGNALEKQPLVTASDAGAGDKLGTSLALDQHTLVVGAPFDDDPADSGAVYVFPLALTKGSPCETDDECATGHCVPEGVCCDTPCDNLCDSCLASRKASGPDGTCGPVSADTDPRGACQGPSCPTATSAHELADLCDGASACAVVAPTECEPGYTCADASCLDSCNDDEQCDSAGGYVCRSGACIVPLTDGEACASGDECASRVCTDGFCCDRACDGQCESCAEPDHVGECVPIEGEPRAGRQACPEADAGCEASCDGTDGARCQFAPGTQSCGGRCEDDAEIVALCDGLGSCVEREPVPCFPFVCGSSQCRVSCQNDDDCALDHACVEGSCEVAKVTCDESGLVSIGPDGDTPCGGYLCDPETGLCRIECASSPDCAPEWVCNPQTRQCEPAEVTAATAGDESSCAVRAPGRSGSASRWLALVLAALALASSFRRRQAHVA